MAGSAGRRVAGLLALLAVCGPARAQGLILDPSGVEQALRRGALPWDARGDHEHADSHIPGAVHVGAAGELFRDPNCEDRPLAALAARHFGQAGMDIPKREIVVYAGKGAAIAYFVARMVEYYGGPHDRIDRGGIDEWKAAGRSLTREPTRRPPVALAEDEVFVNVGAQNGQITAMLARLRALEAEWATLRAAPAR